MAWWKNEEEWTWIVNPAVFKTWRVDSILSPKIHYMRFFLLHFQAYTCFPYYEKNVMIPGNSNTKKQTSSFVHLCMYIFSSLKFWTIPHLHLPWFSGRNLSYCHSPLRFSAPSSIRLKDYFLVDHSLISWIFREFTDSTNSTPPLSYQVSVKPPPCLPSS